MKRLVQVAIICCSLLAIVSCGRHQVKGDGKITTQSRNELGDFNIIKIAGDFSLQVRSNSMQSVQVTSDSNILPYVTTSVKGKSLLIGVKKDYLLQPTKGIDVKVTMKNLKGIVCSGKSIVLASNINTESFALRCSGESRIDLQGNANNVSYLLSGESTLNAINMRGKNVIVNLSGKSDAQVYAEKELNAKITGSGNVVYAGNPSVVKQSASGSGRIRPAE